MFKYIAVLATLIYLLAIPVNSFAYLDPGSGSYIIQIMIGTFLGALFTIKMYWGRIKSFFSHKGKKSEESKE
jgi:hypothetical protein